MRSLCFVAVLACSCTPVDHLVGSYNATVSGMENQTAPTTTTTIISGAGYLAITGSKVDTQSYLLHFGQEGYYCSFKGTKGTMPLEIDIADGQTCKVGTTTFTTTDGKVTLDKDTLSIATLTVSYSYAGQVVFNYSGTGTRTYTGPRL